MREGHHEDCFFGGWERGLMGEMGLIGLIRPMGLMAGRERGRGREIEG